MSFRMPSAATLDRMKVGNAKPAIQPPSSRTPKPLETPKATPNSAAMITKPKVQERQPKAVFEMIRGDRSAASSGPP